MAKRQGGLGDLGKNRFKESLAGGPSAGQRAYPPGSSKAPKQEDDKLDQTLFGGGGGGLRFQSPTPWVFPASSRVHAYQYDPNTQQLRVRFIKYRTPWVYDNVPSTVFQAFDAAPSKGMYINSTLNYFPYRKATPTEESQYFSGT